MALSRRLTAIALEADDEASRDISYLTGLRNEILPQIPAKRARNAHNLPILFGSVASAAPHQVRMIRPEVEPTIQLDGGKQAQNRWPVNPSATGKTRCDRDSILIAARHILPSAANTSYVRSTRLEPYAEVPSK
jgi:hypothetical protein